MPHLPAESQQRTWCGTQSPTDPGGAVAPASGEDDAGYFTRRLGHRRNDALWIYFLEATLASAFVARWCAGYKIETAEGVSAMKKPAKRPRYAILAQRHVAYGVRPEHYELVGAALMWTLAQGLGDDFTPAVSAAWAAAYGALSEIMIAAAYEGS